MTCIILGSLEQGTVTRKCQINGRSIRIPSVFANPHCRQMRVQHVYFSLAVTEQCMVNDHYFNEISSIAQLLLDSYICGFWFYGRGTL